MQVLRHMVTLQSLPLNPDELVGAIVSPGGQHHIPQLYSCLQQSSLMFGKRSISCNTGGLCACSPTSCQQAVGYIAYTFVQEDSLKIVKCFATVSQIELENQTQ